MSGFDNEVLYCIGERLQPSTAQAITLMQKTGDDVSIMNIVGSPEGVDAANPSSLAHDRANGQLYLKRSGVGNTGWLPISTNSQDLHTASFIVSAAGTNGTGANYGNIASAVAAAGNGDTIFIMPGTYTENVTITKNLNFFAYAATLRDSTQNVQITGKITVSAVATIGFFGIRFNTNSDFSFSVTAAASITCQNCYFSATNANSISITAAANFYMENCSGFLANTRALFTTTTGPVWLQNCIFVDSTTPGTSTASAATIRLINCYLAIPFSVSGTGAFIIENTSIGGQQGSATNTTWITTAGTEISYIDNSTFNSGTASAISVGAGTTLTAVGLRVNSSNTNAITGAGTMNFSDVSFSGSSSKNNVTTQSTFISSEFHQVVNQTFTANGTYTPTTGMKYCQVRILGGGGAGGGGPATIAGQYSGGCGGGGGEYAEGVFSADNIGTSQAVTIGAAGTGNSGSTGGNGGNTSLGALITSNGGTGGAALAATVGAVGPTNGGAGGTGGSGGSFRTPGSLGGQAFVNFPANTVIAGTGANSQFGSGGTFTILGTGGAALGYGAGGGGTFNGTSQSAITGGAGSAGIVIITEYI